MCSAQEGIRAAMVTENPTVVTAEATGAMVVGATVEGGTARTAGRVETRVVTWVAIEVA